MYEIAKIAERRSKEGEIYAVLVPKRRNPFQSSLFSQSGRITFNFELRRKLPAQLRSRVHVISFSARGGRYFPLY